LNPSYNAQRGWMTSLTLQCSSGYKVNQAYAYYSNGQLETATDVEQRPKHAGRHEARALKSAGKRRRQRARRGSHRAGR
jgi:hypothetical protein